MSGDVLRLYDERLVLMLTAGEPRYPSWDQDATAVAGRYAERDPARVAAGLRDVTGVSGAAAPTPPADPAAG